jgi:hypothetical protein
MEDKSVKGQEPDMTKGCSSKVQPFLIGEATPESKPRSSFSFLRHKPGTSYHHH